MYYESMIDNFLGTYTCLDNPKRKKKLSNFINNNDQVQLVIITMSSVSFKFTNLILYNILNIIH